MSTTTRPSPLVDDQHAALRALIEADRLPGQPALSAAALHGALAGRSPIDSSCWEKLTHLHTDVLTAADNSGCGDSGGLEGRAPAMGTGLAGAGLVGAVSWGYRASDDTAVLLWLHAREDSTTVEVLLNHVLGHHRGRWEAFDFATALTLGVEALPVRHRGVTAAVLAEHGFAGRDLWRYLHRPLRDLPPRPARALRVRAARLGGCELATEDGLGTVEITASEGGTAMIGWVGVEPVARRRGYGSDLLHAALWHLADRGVHDVVLYVDDDEPGTARDRRAANRLYDRTGFTEVDRLHSYTRP